MPKSGALGARVSRGGGGRGGQRGGKPFRKYDNRNKHLFRKDKKPKKMASQREEAMELLESYSKLKGKKTATATFSQLPLSSLTQKGLEDSKFSDPTEIQRESLPLSLQGKDILGAAKTGSGKTLAFLIPILERLFCQQWSRDDGLGALVISPTRELAQQTFQTLQKVGKYHDFSAGLVIGGTDHLTEAKMMATCNVVICTPGRLLQHMDENPEFDANNLQILVLDEADRILEMSFSAQMNAIIGNLPSERQTLLFSATQTKSVQDLARLSLKNPLYVSVHEHASQATPEELEESYLVCDLEHKLDMLWSFVKLHRKKKIIVFVQSCKQVKFYCDILRRLRVPTQVSGLYGTLNQMRRMAIFKDFSQAKLGVLIATDIAARGLDFPTVDWVYQMDSPEDWKTYNHRVGRTARNKSSGQALLCLVPSEEEAMIKQLKMHKFPIKKEEVDPRRLTSVQRKIEAILASDHELKEVAQRAFKSYLKSIFLMKNKAIFDVTKLDMNSFAASLGLAVPPRVRFIQKHLKAKSGGGGDVSTEAAKEEDPKKDEKKDNKKKIVLESQEDAYTNRHARIESKKVTALTLSDSEDDDDDDSMLTLKRKNHDLAGGGDEKAGGGGADSDSGEIAEGNGETSKTFEQIKEEKQSAKVVTKASLAKKALKKNFQPNQVLKFTDSGHAVDTIAKLKVSDEGREYDNLPADGTEAASSGINIEQAKKVLKAEDAFDRQKEKDRVKERHREQKKKEKEMKNSRRKDIEEAKAEENGEGSSSDYSSEDDGEGPNLDWLPDPDRIYNSKEDGDGDEQDEDDSSHEDSSEGDSEVESSGPKRKWKAPKKKKRAEAEKEKDARFVRRGGS